jgi:hypothetical protein
MILFLDDDPNRAATAYGRMTDEEKESTIWCRTAEEAIVTLRDYKKVLTDVFLDHDLGSETWVHSQREDCGMEVVRFLEKTYRKNPEQFQVFRAIRFIVHTWNTAAGPVMLSRLKAMGLNVTYTPFGM